MRRLLLHSLFAAGLFMSPPSTLQAETGEFRNFRAQYRCEVVNRLERIYAFGDRAQHKDRFLVITVLEHTHGYVQCMFYESGRKLICEASSGYFFSKPDEPRAYRLPSEKIAKLKEMGFSDDDSAGNFRRYMDVGSLPDFNRIADFLLAVLHNGYDANVASHLKFNAPFARGKATTCIPVG
jgi:hypothetical protein